MKLSDYVMQKMNLDEAQKALLIPRIHELEASEKAAVQRMNDAEDAMARMMDELQQTREEIATWEAKAALFVEQGDEIERLRKERDALVQKYNELIMTVATKCPGETRHETALRYILESENRDCGVGMETPRKEIEQERQ